MSAGVATGEKLQVRVNTFWCDIIFLKKHCIHFKWCISTNNLFSPTRCFVLLGRGQGVIFCNFTKISRQYLIESMELNAVVDEGGCSYDFHSETRNK